LKYIIYLFAGTAPTSHMQLLTSRTTTLTDGAKNNKIDIGADFIAEQQTDEWKLEEKKCKHKDFEDKQRELVVNKYYRILKTTVIHNIYSTVHIFAENVQRTRARDLYHRRWPTRLSVK